MQQGAPSAGSAARAGAGNCIAPLYILEAAAPFQALAAKKLTALNQQLTRLTSAH